MLIDHLTAMMMPFLDMSKGGLAPAPGWRSVAALRRLYRLYRATLSPFSGGLPLRADGPVSRRPSHETGPGRAMTMVAVLAAALGVTTCPVAHAASESRSHPILLAQEALAVSPSGASGPVENDRADISGISYTETLAALEAAILRLEGEIAELGRLADWQARLLSAARTDPVGAWRQRRPYASCLKTPLAAWCDRLNGMYRDGARTAGEGDQ